MRVQHPPARLRPPLPRPVWPGPAPRRRWTSACGGARGERRDGLRTRLPGAEPVLRVLHRTHRSQRSLTIRCVVCMITLFSSICFVRAEFPRAVAGHKPGAQRVTTQYCDFRGAILLPPPRCYAGQGGVGRARVTSGRRLCDALKPSSVARARQAAPTRSPSRQGSPATGA